MAAKSIQLSHACAASLVDLSQIRRRIWGVISKIDWRKLARSRFLGDIWNLASTKLQVHHCPCNIRQTLWGLIMGGFSRLKGYPNKIHSGSGSIGEQLPISVASPAPQQQSRSPWFDGLRWPVACNTGKSWQSPTCSAHSKDLVICSFLQMHSTKPSEKPSCSHKTVKNWCIFYQSTTPKTPKLGGILKNTESHEKNMALLSMILVVY